MYDPRVTSHHPTLCECRHKHTYRFACGTWDCLCNVFRPVVMTGVYELERQLRIPVPNPLVVA